ncbi:MULTISPECIES: MarR family transcriptional regulator [unclassified Lactobacillus]|uniref:MarR family winged helix-turn-helix transcriptional regulator n=1 Tax=unclassified Lactobacillus TaxID=2620435 RepID=UPI0023F6E98A|nr:MULTISPECIES: MarR family transcriptional regulator [unclassified Lactobacillus]MDF7668779.1 MarR family transcriptional regulator [Lactobacillus sp. ESL0703]WEV38532.1 MarR family transcriptional regulator [Lactobacillus sp. ESL0680]
MSEIFLNQLGPKFKIANTLIEKALNNRFASIFSEYSLTGAQISLMVYLYDSKGRTITQKEIADTFVLSHPTIRGIVRRLESNQLIETAHLKSDQRQIVLTLSAKGFKLIDDNIATIHQIMAETNQQIIQGMNQQDVEQLSRLLNRIISNF